VYLKFSCAQICGNVEVFFCDRMLEVCKILQSKMAAENREQRNLGSAPVKASGACNIQNN
jgi:hypothetical protein